MREIAAELQRLMRFKNDTQTGDVVVVAALDPRLLLYAVVGPIEPDRSRPDPWWHVTLHLLSMPLQTVVWTLRRPQFTGLELFTMGGNPHFIKALDLEHAEGPKRAEPRFDPAAKPIPRPGPQNAPDSAPAARMARITPFTPKKRD